MTSASRSSETVEHPELASLPERSPPEPANGYLLHGDRPGTGQVRVLLRQGALRRIAEHACSNTRSEVGGALLGLAYRKGEQTFIEVHAALPAVSSDHGPLHFTFNADAWSQLHRDRALHHPGHDIVGWFHTHPDLGVFYSADDVVVHSAAFVMPWHVGLVVDPLGGEAGIFGWVDGEIAPLDGFLELPDLSEDSVWPWRTIRAAVWEDKYEHQAPPETSPAAHSAAEPAPETPRVPDYAVPAVAALGLLLALLTLLFLVLPLYSRVQSLEEVAGMLAAEQLAAASAQELAVCPLPNVRLLSPLPGHTVQKGAAISIVGVADHPAASHYRVQVRPSGESAWNTIGRFRRDISLGRVAIWETDTFTQGDYELRLQPLAGDSALTDAACTITLTLE